MTCQRPRGLPGGLEERRRRGAGREPSRREDFKETQPALPSPGWGENPGVRDTHPHPRILQLAPLVDSLLKCQSTANVIGGNISRSGIGPGENPGVLAPNPPPSPRSRIPGILG
ncbi:unnamed protein product [Lepidochelys olivacea]